MRLRPVVTYGFDGTADNARDDATDGSTHDVLIIQSTIPYHIAYESSLWVEYVDCLLTFLQLIMAIPTGLSSFVNIHHGNWICAFT
jgi:hypothetical protein